ncbi:MAG: diaminopimelate epimerase [Rickettsiales bacterium]|nr:diaminopimelate epimerase [Rickettsiales bacterium]
MPKNIFYKMNGNGNDFIILFEKDLLDIKLTKEFIAKHSNRNTGIGCDQFVVLNASKKSDVKMEIYNQDGSIGAACGNASRCVAWLIGKDLGKTNITIEAQDRILSSTIFDNNIVSVNMGVADFNINSLKLIDQYKEGYIDFDDDKLGNGYFVNVGNDHLVFFVDNISLISAKNHLSKYESHQLFPDHINVSAIEFDGNTIKQVVYERGAGETLSCGTAACAAYAICNKYKNYDGELEVFQPGGSLIIDKVDNEIIMKGAITFEFKSTISN